MVTAKTLMKHGNKTRTKMNNEVHIIKIIKASQSFLFVANISILNVMTLINYEPIGAIAPRSLIEIILFTINFVGTINENEFDSDRVEQIEYAV